MNKPTAGTEVSAVKDARTHFDRVKIKLSCPYTANHYKRIIPILDECDAADALHILSAATKLFEAKFEEVVRENA